MAKHTIWGSFDGANIQYIRPFIEVDWEQNLEQNRTTVTASLYFRRYTNNYWSYNELTNSNGHSCTFSVGGNSLTQIRPFNLQRDDPPNSVLIWTRTRTITHNSNGTASVNISASGDTNVNPRNYDFGETVTLPTIPRQTEINSVSMNNQLRPSNSNTLTVSLDRKHSSYTHRFEILNGSTELQSSTGNLVTSINITSTTVNKMIDLMKTVKTREFTLRVVTLNGTTVIGRKTKNFSVTLNDDYTSPTITGDYHAILGSGYDFDIDKYVQNISRMRVVFGANYGRGADHQSLSVTVDGQPASGIIIPDGRYRANTQTLSKSGTVEIVMTATNSRGQSTSKTVTATVHAYSPPSIREFTAVRSETNPTNILVSRRHTRTSLDGDNLTTSGVIERQTFGSSTWQEVNDAINTTLSTTLTGNSETTSYTFRTTVTDRFGNSATSEVSVGTARVLQEKYKDVGISVGQRFDPNNPAIFQVGGSISMIDIGGRTLDLLNPEFVPAILENGWVDSGGPPIGFYKIGGVVYMSGRPRHTTVSGNSVIFRLPEGLRPVSHVIFYPPSNGGITRRVDILNSGYVRYTDSAANVNFISLDAISFPVGG